MECNNQMSHEEPTGMRERALALICLLLLSTISNSAAVPEEDQNFQPSHTGVDFPVGYVDFAQQGGTFEEEHRLVYPALNSGEGQEMAEMDRFHGSCSSLMRMNLLTTTCSFQHESLSVVPWFTSILKSTAKQIQLAKPDWCHTRCPDLG